MPLTGTVFLLDDALPLSVHGLALATRLVTGALVYPIRGLREPRTVHLAVRVGHFGLKHSQPSSFSPVVSIFSRRIIVENKRDYYNG